MKSTASDLTKTTTVSDTQISNTELPDKRRELIFSKRLSRRLTYTEPQVLDKPTSIPQTKPNKMKSDLASIFGDNGEMTRDIKISLARRVLDELKSSPPLHGSITIFQLEKLGKISKAGYMMKQSKLLGRQV